MKTINYLSAISKILQTRRTDLVDKKAKINLEISTANKFPSELNTPLSKSNKTIDFLNDNEFVYFWEAPKWLIN